MFPPLTFWNFHEFKNFRVGKDIRSHLFSLTLIQRSKKKFILSPICKHSVSSWILPIMENSLPPNKNSEETFLFSFSFALFQFPPLPYFRAIWLKIATFSEMSVGVRERRKRKHKANEKMQWMLWGSVNIWWQIRNNTTDKEHVKWALRDWRYFKVKKERGQHGTRHEGTVRKQDCYSVWLESQISVGGRGSRRYWVRGITRGCVTEGSQSLQARV